MTNREQLIHKLEQAPDEKSASSTGFLHRAETIKDIVQVLRRINPSAAEEFIRLYLGDDSERDEEL